MPQHTLKEKPVRFANGLKVGCEGKRGIKGDPRSSISDSCKEGVTIT